MTKRGVHHREEVRRKYWIFQPVLCMYETSSNIFMIVTALILMLDYYFPMCNYVTSDHLFQMKVVFLILMCTCSHCRQCIEDGKKKESFLSWCFFFSRCGFVNKFYIQKESSQDIFVNSLILRCYQLWGINDTYNLLNDFTEKTNSLKIISD